MVGRLALAGCTSAAAWAARQDDRGRLLPGYFADLTVLSVDPAECGADRQHLGMRGGIVQLAHPVALDGQHPLALDDHGAHRRLAVRGGLLGERQGAIHRGKCGFRHGRVVSGLPAVLNCPLEENHACRSASCRRT